MVSLSEALEPLGIKVTETIKNKVATLDLESVSAENQNQLNPIILKINGALQEAGLLDKWRAQKGGTTTERWILLIGQKHNRRKF